MRTGTIAVLAAGAATAMAGCIRPWVDLYIVGLPSMAKPIAYCRLNTDRQLVITVRNPGNEEGEPSKTRVTFTSLPSGPYSIDLPTPRVFPEDEVTLPPIDLASLPSNCFQPDCRFTIRVDVENAVFERDEGDNEVVGSCPG